MSEETQLYLGFQMGSADAESGFQGALNYIREVAPSESHKGQIFREADAGVFPRRPHLQEAVFRGTALE